MPQFRDHMFVFGMKFLLCSPDFLGLICLGKGESDLFAIPPAVGFDNIPLKSRSILWVYVRLGNPL